MQLSFQSSFLSIKEFPSINVPRFTLITGLNGTGKSHLLRAIVGQHIRSDQAPNPSNDVRFFDWTNMVPNDTGPFDGHTFIQEQNGMYEQFFNARRVHEDQIIAAARGAGLTGRSLSNVSEIALLNIEDLRTLLGSDEAAITAHQSIKSAVEATSGNLMGHVGANFHAKIRLISEEFKRPIAALERADFFRSKLMPSWGQTTIFQHSFAQLFVAYRDLALTNAIRQLQQSKGKDVFAYTDDEFVKQHMAPPWDFVNESLNSSGLGFRINRPDEHDFTPYEPRLTKISSNAEVRFSDLSSGEKVLMSFALCLYFANDRRQLAAYPKLLLLDEIDAPLHPSMSKGLLSTITDTLVEAHNIHVIATTHSPSTVAMAPEDSIFAMRPETPGLQKISKNEALNLLTEGVPTLSVSFSGRRQVFVESPQDATLYDQLYQILKTKFMTERSLEFVATGTKSKKSGTDMNTGCDVVRHLVESLSEAGNTSVFGVVDWDSKNAPSSRVKVIAHEKRNGLENLIFDPLLLASLIVNRFRAYICKLGIDEDIPYTAFLSFGVNELQEVTNRIQNYVFDGNAGPTDTVEYLGGFSLQVSRKYLHGDDHSLEELLLEKLPNLKSIGNKAGALMNYIAANIVRDKPDFLPIEVMRCFEELLNAPAH